MGWNSLITFKLQVYNDFKKEQLIAFWEWQQINLSSWEVGKLKNQSFILSFLYEPYHWETKR